MTIPEPETEANPPADQPLIYYVNFDRLAELNRSAIAVLADRRLPSCPSMQKPDQELNDVQKLVDEIAKYCADDDDFIRTEMPIQEIVFRVLLSRRNAPTSLADLHHALTEKWATPVRPINVSEVGLRRIIDADIYYGFAQVNTGPADE